MAQIADPWTFEGESPSLGGPTGTVTLVQGSSFCISSRSGDVLPDRPHGLFFRDTRFLSRFELRINGQQPEPLTADSTDPFSATFVLRTRPRAGRADSTLTIMRYRYVGRGMREDIVVSNYGEEAAYCSVELQLDADFADLFVVKEGRVEPSGDATVESVDGGTLVRESWDISQEAGLSKLLVGRAGKKTAENMEKTLARIEDLVTV